MAVPGWTKEWRPLARELCVRTSLFASRSPATINDVTVNDTPASTSNVTGDSVNPLLEASASLSSTMHEALQVDRVVAQLYSHRFLEVHRKQVVDEINSIAAKLQIHSLGDRSKRLKELAAVCADEHYQVLKLLIELADSPTTASDEDVAVGRDEALYTQQLQEQNASRVESELYDRLAEELFEISTNDEWYQQWEDSDEEEIDAMDGGNYDGDSDSILSGWSDADDGGLRIGRKRMSNSRMQATDRDGEKNDDDDNDNDDPMSDQLVSAAINGDEVVDERDTQAHAEDSGESAIIARDELLLRYYPKALDGAVKANTKTSNTRTSNKWDSDMLLHHGDAYEEISESGSMAVDDEVGHKVPVRPKETPPSLLSLETPGLLYPTLQRYILQNGTAKLGEKKGFITAHHWIVHERTLVTAVFQALAGVDSLVFEVNPASESGASMLFSSDFVSCTVQLSQAARGIAVGHLSPSALYQFLSQFARAATDLQLLRDLVGFISQDTFKEQRCCTLEGLAQALAKVVRGFDQAIWRTQNASVVSRSSPVTLLSVYGELKPLFGKISWLKSVLVGCFCEFADREHHEVSIAKRAKSVLDALYVELEVEYVQGIHSTTTNRRGNEQRDHDCSTADWSRYDILMHLFVCALTPYLDLLQVLLFEKGHNESIELHEELFFVAPLAIKYSSSPLHHDISDAQRSQSFKDALLALAPFEVDAVLIPVFLAAAIPFLNEAIASRQMKNRYLQQRMSENDLNDEDHDQQQHAKKAAAPPVPRVPGRMLSELFLDDLVSSGVYGDSCDSNTPESNQSVNVAQLSVQNMPFSRAMKQCLLMHVEQKCRELNGAMASLFRQRLQYLDHVDALRSFVLMQQQDVFSMLSVHLLQQMEKNPITWADSERINNFYQTSIQILEEERAISLTERQVGSRLCVRINATLLKSLGVVRKIDISALKCLYFTFSTPQPLRVLFSSSIMRKYSRLATFLLQVKTVESAIIKISNTSWGDVRTVLETSESISMMDEAHEQYLDQLLNKFFLLEKHTTVIQYILTTFNHVMRFVSQVDELVNTVERNIPRYFPGSPEKKKVVDLDEFNYKFEDEEVHDGSEGNTAGESTLSHPGNGTPNQNILLRKEHKFINDEITRSASEFKRQSHFLVVMLTAMHKHGASPHVAEILTQLNFNYFYHQQEQQQQQHSFVSSDRRI